MLMDLVDGKGEGLTGIVLPHEEVAIGGSTAPVR